MGNTSSSTSSDDDYHYLSLDNNLKEIRLLILKQGSRADRIECGIKHVSLDSHHYYHALSYAWGTSEEDRVIYVEGHPFHVNSNLSAALEQLRLPTEPRYLWIDRICINQNDILERGSQVSQMREIYENAARVVVWLGVESLRSAAAIECMKNLARSISRRGLYLSSSGKLETENLNALLAILEEQGLHEIDISSLWLSDIIEFLGRPWWSRVWVRQEFAVARSVDFTCGSEIISWKSIEPCVKALIYLIDSRVINPITAQNRKACDLILDRRHYIRLRKDTQSGHRSSLLSLAWRHARSPIADATDHRDRIYALLGLSKDQLGLEPDYSISADVLVRRFVKAHISGMGTNSRRLGILSAHHNVAKPRFPGLPSWAPDFVTHTKKPMTGVTVETRRIFSASGLEDLPPLELDFHSDDKRLPLSGYCIGAINVIGPLGKFANVNDTGISSAVHQFKASESLALAVEQLIHEHSKFEDITKPTDGSPEEDVCRLLILDKDLDTALHGEKVRAGATMLPLYRNTLERDNPPKDFMPHDNLDSRRMEFSKLYTQKVLKRMLKRQVFISSSGNLGAGPDTLRKNDLLCVLLGAEVPYVLRPKGDGFILIGEAYIQGFMDGEVLTGGFEKRVFTLI